MNSAQKKIAIIPARMGSSRFPGKPMAEILGMPMIGHVYHRVKQAECLDTVVVATCDAEIFAYVESIGGRAVMTKSTHERCTDRTAEALLKVEALDQIRYEIVVMVQGDEPMVTPRMIEAAVEPLTTDEFYWVTNLMGELENETEAKDANAIKVVCNQKNEALYFSRAPIPYFQGGKLPTADYKRMKQVCVIPFRRSALIQFNEMPQTLLEQAESIDMMRFVENGIPVKMVAIAEQSYPVDTVDDMERVKRLLENDFYAKLYLKNEEV